MNIKRVFKSLILFFIILIVTISTVSAFGIEDISGDISEANTVRTMGNKAVQIVSRVSSILSVIVIIILGIKYMMGSVDEKAEYKKTLLPFLIGAIFIFAASNIASKIYNLAIQI